MELFVELVNPQALQVLRQFQRVTLLHGEQGEPHRPHLDPRQEAHGHLLMGDPGVDSGRSYSRNSLLQASLFPVQC